MNSKNSLRVLHVYTGNLFGGVETALIAIAKCRSLCPEMEPSFAICFRGKLSHELLKMGVQVYILEDIAGGISKDTLYFKERLAAIVSEGKYDVVLFHQFVTFGILGMVIKDKQIRKFVWSHGAPHPLWEMTSALMLPDGIIFNSQYLKSSTKCLFSGIRSEVVYYPTILPNGSLTKIERLSVREQLQCPEDKVVVIHVSRMVRMKGHSRLLNSLERLKDISNWTCWIVGGPQSTDEQEYFDELKEHSERLKIANRIKFPGECDNVSDLLDAADIFCQPNLEVESYGMSFVEALSASSPVITTAFGGALEIVTDKCGLLVPPDDDEALTNALKMMIESPSRRNTAGLEGRKRAFELCHPERNLRQLWEILK